MEEKSENCRKQSKTLPHTQTVKIQLYASVLPAIRRQRTILSRTTGINAATFAAVLGRYTACCVYNRAIEHPRPRSSLQCNKLGSRSSRICTKLYKHKQSKILARQTKISTYRRRWYAVLDFVCKYEDYKSQGEVPPPILQFAIVLLKYLDRARMRVNLNSVTKLSHS